MKVVIESSFSHHLMVPGINAEGFKIARGRHVVTDPPHWLRGRVQPFLDAKGKDGKPLMTWTEVQEPAPERADTDPAPPPSDAPATDGQPVAADEAAPEEGKKKRR